MTAPEILYALITFMLGVLTGVYIAERHKDAEPARDGVEGGSYTWPETTIDWPDVPTVTVGGKWGEIDRAATRAAHGATEAALARLGPRLVITSDLVEQGRPRLLGPGETAALIGCEPERVLKALGR